MFGLERVDGGVDGRSDLSECPREKAHYGENERSLSDKNLCQNDSKQTSKNAKNIKQQPPESEQSRGQAGAAGGRESGADKGVWRRVPEAPAILLQPFSGIRAVHKY